MRKNDIDLVGKTFGYLTVIQFAEIRNHRSFWLCKCKCGNEILKRSDGLHEHSSCVSCKAEKQRIRMTRHNETKTRLYQIWRGMRNRCNKPNDSEYQNYGGRGIKVYEEWNNSYESFKDYVSKLSHYGEKGYTLDRIDVNGNYEPGNIRWANAKTQANNRRDNHIVEFNGLKLTLKQWSEKLDIPYSTLSNRINRYGWSEYDAFTKPVQVHRRA